MLFQLRNNLELRTLGTRPRTKWIGRRKLSLESLEERTLLSLSTMDLTGGLTPHDLAEALVGIDSGITISNATYVGDLQAAGMFAGGVSEDLGIEAGVMLSSGRIADAAGPNNSDATTSAFGRPGDSDLNGLIPGYSTNDASVLEFDFETTGGTLSFQYVFGSEEYNEWVNSPFNDVFGFFMDGVNIAVLPGTSTSVAINNINNSLNSSLYRNNDPSDLGIPTPFATEADGFTAVLQAAVTVTPGTHHIKLATADAGDHILDSWVFLLGDSFVSTEADLGLTKVDSPDPVQVGKSLEYTLVVTNNGPDEATQVTLQDDLPDDVTFVSATASQGAASYAGGFVTANLGSLADGESATVTIEVIPTAAGTITNSATVQASQFDTNLDNNSTSEDTLVIETIEIGIDIKPFDESTPINLWANGVIPVAVFTTESFDAASVDVSTVTLAGASVDHYAFEDVDGDGDLDLIMHFRLQDTALLQEYHDIVMADLEDDGILDGNRKEYDLTLTGLTTDGLSFEGTETVDIFLAGKALNELLASL